MAEEKQELEREAELDFKLQHAMLEDHEKEADPLISQGADIHTLQDDSDRTLLHLAAYHGNVHNISWLVEEHGFDVRALDCYQNTPAHMAAMNGQLDAIFVLEHYGADIEKKNYNQQTVKEILQKNFPKLIAAFDDHFKPHTPRGEESLNSISTPNPTPQKETKDYSSPIDPSGDLSLTPLSPTVSRVATEEDETEKKGRRKVVRNLLDTYPTPTHNS